MARKHCKECDGVGGHEEWCSQYDPCKFCGYDECQCDAMYDAFVDRQMEKELE